MYPSFSCFFYIYISRILFLCLMLSHCSSLFKATLLFLLLAGAIQTLINYWSRSPEVTQPLRQQADKNGTLSAPVYLLLSFSKQTNKLNYLVCHFVRCTNISCFLQSLFSSQGKSLKTPVSFWNCDNLNIHAKEPKTGLNELT